MTAELDPSFFGIHEDIILTKNGIWLSNGEEILHEGTVRAFSRNIYRCKDGFEIRLGNEKKSIHIEDTLYFVNQIEGDDQIGFNLRLNDGRTVELDPKTLQYKTGRLTAKVYHPNEKTNEDAKFLTAAYYEFLKYIEHDDKTGFWMIIEGKKIVLSKD